MISYESDFVDGNHRKRKPMGVTDMLKNASLAATLGVWQILELQETDTLGEFMVWAMTGRSQLQKFRLVVPRILYVNSLGAKLKNNEKDLKCQLVVKDLPHAKKRYDLYELSLPETKYQNNERASSLLMYNSQVEGVYESSTPLLFRAILKLGCSARFSKYSEKMNPTKFNFHDLEFLNVSNHPYLTISSGVFRRIYCYCVTDRNRQSDRGVLGLFILDETFTDNENIDVNYPQPAKAYIWISSGRKSLVDSRPPMARLYRKFQSNEKVNVKFTTNSLSQLSDCFKACNDILAQYLRQRHGPTLVIAQGSVEARQWRRHMSSLHEFPLATIPMNSSDDLFPAIGWQMFAAERLIQRYLFFPTWFKDRLECARYAHIPVCNLGMDAPTTMTDVMFARQLQHNRHLLWCSEGTKPDLGTSEALHHNAWSEPLREPVLNQPGSFSSICVELDLFGLDVAAILQSGMLDTDGLSAHSTYSNMSAFSAATSNLLQEVDYSGGISSNAVTTDTSCGRAFSLLKALIAKLFDDAEVRGNVISDSLLKNLYRYLCGFGNPLMNDPALHQLVFRLKCRLFTKFLSALRKIGVILVFADFSKIILSTNKHNLNSAYEYVGYITEVVREDILFSKIEIVAKTYWEQLLWMSAENWAGIKISFDVDDGNLPNNEVARIDGDVGECARTDFVATESGVLKSTQHGKLVPVKHDSEYDFLDDLLPMKTINNTEDRTNSRKEGSETYDSDEDERYNNENDFNRDDRNDELFWDSLDENVDDGTQLFFSIFSN
jgi:DNA polymerase epsilon subunit 1